jgi:hypothetical protein
LEGVLMRFLLAEWYAVDPFETQYLSTKDRAGSVYQV